MVIEFNESDKNEALNGLFSFVGRKKDNSQADTQASNRIEDIKADNGFNDIMYMEPKQAAISLNEMIMQLAYFEALSNRDASKYKTDNSIKQAQKHAKLYSDAASEVVSQFRMYAVGFDGELKKLGTSKKTIDGFVFQAPFYKLSLPIQAEGKTLEQTVSKTDLAAMFGNIPVAKASETVEAPKNNNTLIIGGAIASALLIGTIVYVSKSKTKN